MKPNQPSVVCASRFHIWRVMLLNSTRTSCTGPTRARSSRGAPTSVPPTGDLNRLALGCLAPRSRRSRPSPS